MRHLTRLLTVTTLALALLIGPATTRSVAGANDPLFVNLISDDAHRARMALTFSKNQQERGHPVTIFFNDKGVLVTSMANAGSYGEQQKAIGELIAKGATILVCPMCMKHYGVEPTTLVPGAKVGNPDLLGEHLFKDNTKTLTW